MLETDRQKIKFPAADPQTLTSPQLPPPSRFESAVQSVLKLPRAIATAVREEMKEIERENRVREAAREVESMLFREWLGDKCKGFVSWVKETAKGLFATQSPHEAVEWGKKVVRDVAAGLASTYYEARTIDFVFRATEEALQSSLRKKRQNAAALRPGGNSAVVPLAAERSTSGSAT